MGLFAQDAALENTGAGDASRRMAGIRERGTGRLLLLFAVLVAGYFAYSKIADWSLLQKKWPALTPDSSGLTVVGTLDSRGDYDRNMFKILQVNKSTRVELTDFGWRTIFSGTGGPLFEDKAGNAIVHALDIDNATGYAMLEPYLRVGVARMMGQPENTAVLSENTPVAHLSDASPKQTAQQETLGALLKKYSEGSGKLPGEEHDKTSEGSGSGREVEHGITIPGNVLADSCPIVLTSAQFNEAELLPQPETILSDKTFSVRLHLTAEGRSRFYQWSRNHVNESVVFALRGETVAAGRVPQTLDVNWWDITNVRDEAAAKAIVQFVNDRAKR